MKSSFKPAIIMSRLLFILFPIYLFSCNQHSKRDVKLFSGDIKNDLQILLPSGKHVALLFDSVKQTPNQILLSTFKKSVSADSFWFAEYAAAYKGKILPYHKKMGITKGDYQVMLESNEFEERVQSAQESLFIFKRIDTIIFKGSGKLSILDSLKVNLAQNNVNFKSYKLSYQDTVWSDNKNDGLGDFWRGYYYKYEQDGILGIPELRVLNPDRKEFELAFGQNINGQTIIILDAINYENNQKIVDLSLHIRLIIDTDSKKDN